MQQKLPKELRIVAFHVKPRQGFQGRPSLRYRGVRSLYLCVVAMLLPLAVLSSTVRSTSTATTVTRVSTEVARCVFGLSATAKFVVRKL